MEDCNVSSWQGLHELPKLLYETREGKGGIPRHEPKEQDFELNALGETLRVTKELSFRIIFWQSKHNICIWVYMPKQDKKYLSARVGKIISKSPAQKPADCVSKTCETHSPKSIYWRITTTLLKSLISGQSQHTKETWALTIHMDLEFVQWIECESQLN